MDRLRDQTAPEAEASDASRTRALPETSAARRLLQRVPPSEVSSVSKARVWAKLRRRQPSRARYALRFALLAVLLCSSIAFARSRLALFGALSSRFFGDAEHNAPVSLPAPPAPPVTSRLVTPASSSSTPVTEIPMMPAPVEMPSAPAGTAPTPSVRTVVASEPVRTQDTPKPRSAEEEADLVLDGLRALRRDHDAPRARALFARYLGRHPQGPLAEDALGYSLEAADAEGTGQASRLAEAYLRSYPHGRYAVLAERLRNRPAP
jgi:hypothetical protein